MQLEQQIYSIEAANINHETLAAMKQAGAAMKQIHGGMKLEDVDKTMYVVTGSRNPLSLIYPIAMSWLLLYHVTAILISRREELQDQHALSAEIGSVITSFPIGEQPDEEELDAELEDLEQETMDAKMLHTGTVPVGSQLDRLPAVGNTDRKREQDPIHRYHCISYVYHLLTGLPIVKHPAKAQEEDDEEAELAKLRAEMAM